ncbi:MAG: hypothetical protein ACOYY2_08765, partial [Actinomycetota bacterium]
TYAGSNPGKPYPMASNVRYRNNVFGRMYYPQCGLYGPVTSFAPGNGNEWTGNVWEDGTPVSSN